VCASDNYGLECAPPVPGSPFIDELKDVSGILPAHVGIMHQYMIPLIGLVVGEQWDLEALAQDCARDGVWECLVTVKPLYLTGGVGSPANATAVK
jgi:hypothetical protein